MITRLTEKRRKQENQFEKKIRAAPTASVWLLIEGVSMSRETVLVIENTAASSESQHNSASIYCLCNVPADIDIVQY